MSFKRELESLINRHSKENESNTPDFILAGYMHDCLKAFNLATQQRETWHGRDARPTSTVESIKVHSPDAEQGGHPDQLDLEYPVVHRRR